MPKMAVHALENLSAGLRQADRLTRPDDHAFRDVKEVGLRDLRRRRGAGGSPAIQVRFSRFCGTVQQDPIQGQKTQIVQC